MHRARATIDVVVEPAGGFGKFRTTILLEEQSCTAGGIVANLAASPMFSIFVNNSDILAIVDADGIQNLKNASDSIAVPDAGDILQLRLFRKQAAADVGKTAAITIMKSASFINC